MDSDAAGEEKKKTLAKNLYKDKEDKLISVSEFIHTKVDKPEIEDLMDYDVLMEVFNREFHSENEDFEYDKSSSKNVVQQIEDFSKENDITLFEGWKVKLAQRYVSKDRNETKKILEKWIKIFNKFIEE